MALLRDWLGTSQWMVSNCASLVLYNCIHIVINIVVVIIISTCEFYFFQFSPPCYCKAVSDQLCGSELPSGLNHHRF